MELRWQYGIGIGGIRETRFLHSGRDTQLLAEMDPLEREILRTVLAYLLKRVDKAIEEAG